METRQSFRVDRDSFTLVCKALQGWSKKTTDALDVLAVTWTRRWECSAGNRAGLENSEGVTEEVMFKLGTEGFSFNRWRRGTNNKGMETWRSLLGGWLG